MVLFGRLLELPRGSLHFHTLKDRPGIRGKFFGFILHLSSPNLPYLSFHLSASSSRISNRQRRLASAATMPSSRTMIIPIIAEIAIVCCKNGPQRAEIPIPKPVLRVSDGLRVKLLAKEPLPQ